MRRILFFTLAYTLNTLSAYAGLLKGKVTDEQGTHLPYATIFIEGTTTGVNANGNGDFELAIQPGLYKVVCQYIGYKQNSFNVSFSGNETIEHNFVLKDQSLEMKEVVILANTEDPAYAIIRNAIKKREHHLDQVKSFQTSIYFKAVARSRQMPGKFLGKVVIDESDVVDSMGKGVLYLAEEHADYYSTRDKNKTVIHSVRESGNANGLGLSRFPSVITFYENNVNVMGRGSRGFISPISDNALMYYKYKLLGEFTELGHTVYKIQVIPKRAYEPCFSGIIYIVDEDWAVHSLNMALTRQSGMDMVDTLKIDQILLPLEKDTWVIKSQVLYFALKIFTFDITGTGVAVYNNQVVNHSIPDSIFADKIVSIYDKLANKKDSSYWDNARPIPLEKDEKDNFVSKDSLNKIITSPRFVDSLRRKENKIKPVGLFISGWQFHGKKYKNNYSTNPILFGSDNMVNYNTVEGFNAAPKLHYRRLLDTGKNLFTDIAVRYGFTNTHLNAIGRVYYVTQDKSFPNRAWTYGIEGGKYVFQYNPENPVSEWLKSYYALFVREGDLKIYERYDASAYVSRNYGTGIAWYLKASYQQRLPLENTSTYSFLKGGIEGFKTNAPAFLVNAATAWEKHDAALIEASISYKPGIKYIQYPDHKRATGSNWPRFTLTYKKGIPGLFNSVVDFDKWRFSVRDEQHMRLLGSINYHLAVGGFLNSNYVSIPDLTHLYGNRGMGIASPYLESFQMAPFYNFSNKEPIYGEAHIEYHLKGLLSNKIPLLRQARWYLLVGGNAFYATEKQYYTEAFVGIDNIGYKLVRVARVDFVQSWDCRGGQNSGIRASINLPITSTVRYYPMQGEW